MYDLKFSENSYLHHFSAQVSQIVFLAYLTVLRLFTTVWPKMSENSYLRPFSAQVSQSVFLAYLKILQTYYNCMTWNVRKLISPPFQCTSITKCFFSLYLTVLRPNHNCMTWNVRKLISPRFQCTSITNSVFRLASPFDGLLRHYDLKCSENSYLCHFSAQVSQIVFIAYLTVLRLITICKT